MPRSRRAVLLGLVGAVGAFLAILDRPLRLVKYAVLVWAMVVPMLMRIDPAALRPVKVNFVPHRDGRRGVAPREGLDFVEFAMKRPKAKSVSLIGDFNGFTHGADPLHPVESTGVQSAGKIPERRAGFDLPEDMKEWQQLAAKEPAKEKENRRVPRKEHTAVVRGNAAFAY